MTPTAVRVVWDPAEAGAAQTARGIAVALQTAGIRADLDDRQIPLPRKLREARQDLVPYQIIVDRTSTDHDVTVLAPDIQGAGPLHPEPAAARHQTLARFIGGVTNREDFTTGQAPAVSPTLSSQPWRRSL